MTHNHGPAVDRFLRRRRREIFALLLFMSVAFDTSYGLWNFALFAVAIGLAMASRVQPARNAAKACLAGYRTISRDLAQRARTRDINKFPSNSADPQFRDLWRITLEDGEGNPRYVMRALIHASSQILTRNGRLVITNVTVQWCNHTKDVSPSHCVVDIPLDGTFLHIDIYQYDLSAPPGIKPRQMDMSCRIPRAFSWAPEHPEPVRRDPRDLRTRLLKLIAEIPCANLRSRAEAIANTPITSAASLANTRRKLALLLHPDLCRTFNSTPVIARINAQLDRAKREFAWGSG